MSPQFLLSRKMLFKQPLVTVYDWFFIAVYYWDKILAYRVKMARGAPKWHSCYNHLILKSFLCFFTHQVRHFGVPSILSPFLAMISLCQ